MSLTNRHLIIGLPVVYTLYAWVLVQNLNLRLRLHAALQNFVNGNPHSLHFESLKGKRMQHALSTRRM